MKIPIPNRDTVCDLQRRIARRTVELGIPERFVGDTHAMSSAEYFAIAIETMVHFPDMFCAGYSAAERQWLADNMGDCIKPTRSSCPKDPPTGYLDGNPTPAKWFKP